MPPEDLDLQVEDTPVVEAPAEKILGRYETVDELTKAHEHLDLRFSKQGTELGEERRAREAAEARAAELEGLVAQQQPQQQQYGPIDQNPLVQYAQDKLMEGDIGPFLNLTADIARAQATEIAGQQPKPEAPATPQDFDQLAFNAEQQVLQRHGQAYVDLRDKVSQKLE